ncbi:MAG: DUF4355 domain-containing protein [Oscillospiraceae bacterium]
MNEEMLGNKVAEDVGDAATEQLADTRGEEQAESPAPEKKYTDDDVDKIIARKIAAERKKVTKLLNEEQQETELEKRERAVVLRELKADARDTLEERHLPRYLDALLDYNSRESLKQSMEKVGAIFNEAVQRGINDRFKGSGRTPKTGTPAAYSDEVKSAFAPKN